MSVNITCTKCGKKPTMGRGYVYGISLTVEKLNVLKLTQVVNIIQKACNANGLTITRADSRDWQGINSRRKYTDLSISIDKKYFTNWFVGAPVHDVRDATRNSNNLPQKLMGLIKKQISTVGVKEYTIKINGMTEYKSGAFGGYQVDLVHDFNRFDDSLSQTPRNGDFVF